MTKRENLIAINAMDAPVRTKPSNYPEPFASRMVGREKRSLGDLFALANFGVNLTRLAPNAVSALRHAHTKQDEFIYILQGRPTLYTDEGLTELSPGMCAGFKAGSGNGHHLVNETSEEVVYIEVGIGRREMKVAILTTISRQWQRRVSGNSPIKTAHHTHNGHFKRISSCYFFQFSVLALQSSLTSPFCSYCAW
ncbi:cupin domain-containing protein [Yersinia bercovieri]|uniref:cupin domain-containing protein n=1 Tax=Yersinia bercovieri TaxID=634 RepID=UPI0023EF437D|nr:cupin domain-containing protein [Yersinia bercovieri]